MSTCLVCGSKRLGARQTKKGYGLVKCQLCGLRWVDPIPTPEVLEDYYSTNYRLAAHHQEINLERAARDVDLLQSWIKEYAPNTRVVCEIGCATGHLLSGLKERGFDVKGYELSSVTSQFAREKLGIDVTTGSFSANGVAFDAILMRHVLEHTPNPVEQIGNVAQRLSAGGLLILAVPNGAGAGFRLLGEYWTWYVPPAHLWYFTNRSLRRLLKDQGLEPVMEMTRQGDANNFLMELSLGAARWVRGLVKHSRIVDLVPQSPENLPGSGRLRQLLQQITYILNLPFQLCLHQVGLGDELWLVARKR